MNHHSHHPDHCKIRRIGEVSLLFSLSCTITLTAFISPYISDRDLARNLHDGHNPPIPFIEVYVEAPLSVVEERDPKGLYAKARKGEIKGGSECRVELVPTTHLPIHLNGRRAVFGQGFTVDSS